MKPKIDVLSLTVEDLALSAGTTRWAKKLVAEEFRLDISDKPIFVEDVIRAYEKRAHADRYVFSRRKLPSETNFLRKLTELGLTRFDFIYLSPKTVTLKKQKSFTKEEWLAMPALLLGTMKPYTIEYFAQRDEGITDVLVGHLLGEDHRVREHYAKKFHASFTDTRALLKKLGFTSKDGGIMLIGTVDGRAQELARKYGVSMGTARTIVRIAKLEGWRYVAD